MKRPFLAYPLLAIGIFAVLASLVTHATSIVDAAPWTHAPTSLSLTSPSPTPSFAHLLRRDPFAPVGGTAALTSDGIPAVLPLPRALQDGTQTIVPNPGSMTASQTTSITLLGVALGDARRPMALVQLGTTTAVFAVGDMLAGKRISAITSNGIIFADRSLLAIPTTTLLPTDTTAGLQNAPPVPSTPAPLAASTTPPPSTPAPTPTPPSIYRLTPAYFPLEPPDSNTTLPIATPVPNATLAPVPQITLPPR